LMIAEVVVRGGWVRCPFCRLLLDFCLLRCTRLGPSRLECPRCNHLLISHRKEWAEMTWSERWAFVWDSLLYAVSVSVVGFVVVLFLFPRLSLGYLLVNEVLFGFVPLAFAGSVVGVQLTRLLNSYSRSRYAPREASRPTFWSMDFHMQSKFLFLIL